jgi:hypothetical protein
VLGGAYWGGYPYGYDYDYGYYAGPTYYSAGVGNGFALCARTFRSFNPQTGLYRTYDGRLLRCPYI